MPNSLVRVLVLSIMTIAAFGTARGQESNLSEGPSGKVIEIQSSRSPQPLLIVLSHDRRSGFWASGFTRLKDWKVPDTGDPIQAMDFRARLVGDHGELDISLFRGKRFGEITENVAHIVLSVGDTVIVSELKKFGFEPVTVKMSLVPTTIADVPLVSNPAPMLRTTVSNFVSTLPAFKVRFLNESKKDVAALAWYTVAGDKKLMSALAQAEYGKPLIEANGSYELNIRAENPDPSEDYISFVIGAVIYEDGTVEGDALQAANFFSFSEGRKKALGQLVPLLFKTAEQNSQSSDIPTLIAAVDNLTDGGPRVSGRPRSPVGIAFAAVISEALESLRQLNSVSVGKPDVEVRRSLTQLAEFYRDWQNRMQK